MAGEQFGWGEEGASERSNLYVEAIENELLIKEFGEQTFSRPGFREESHFENRLRETMPFDEGWDFEFASRIAFGRKMHHGPQNTGNCVGYSNSNGVAARIAHEIVCLGQPEEFLGDYRAGTAPMPHVGYSYGMGRMEGNMLNSGAGSYCSVQLRANKKHGFLPCDTPGIDTGDPQPSTGNSSNEWGRNRQLLMKWRPFAVQQSLEHSYQVKTEDDMWSAINDDKHPVQICSMRGFTAKRKIQWDDFWFWEWVFGPTWAHSMIVMGAYLNPRDGDRWYKVTNQWGNYHKGFHFFHVSSDTMRRWVPQSDSRTIGEVKGRPSDSGFPA